MSLKCLYHISKLHTLEFSPLPLIFNSFNNFRKKIFSLRKSRQEIFSYPLFGPINNYVVPDFTKYFVSDDIAYNQVVKTAVDMQSKDRRAYLTGGRVRGAKVTPDF